MWNNLWLGLLVSNFSKICTSVLIITILISLKVKIYISAFEDNILCL